MSSKWGKKMASLQFNASGIALSLLMNCLVQHSWHDAASTEQCLIYSTTATSYTELSSACVTYILCRHGVHCSHFERSRCRKYKGCVWRCWHVFYYYLLLSKLSHSFPGVGCRLSSLYLKRLIGTIQANVNTENSHSHTTGCVQNVDFYGRHLRADWILTVFRHPQRTIQC